MPKPIEFRSQGAYLQIISNRYELRKQKKSNKVVCWYGIDCSEEVKKGALILGVQLALSRNAEFVPNLKELNSHVLKFVDLELEDNQKVHLLSLEKSSKRIAPRMFRIYGNEGEELIYERYDKGINFTFRQADLRLMFSLIMFNFLLFKSDKIINRV